mgnify:FL=1
MWYHLFTIILEASSRNPRFSIPTISKSSTISCSRVRLLTLISYTHSPTQINTTIVYSIPNIVLPFFTGYLVDRIGAPRISIVLTMILVIGHLILCLGVSAKSTVLMIVGRTVFGLGGEGLQVAQSTIISHHFKGSELAFAMGLQLSVARGGSVLAFNIAPHLASTYNVLTPLYLGVVICGIGVLAAILLIPFDMHRETETLSSSDDETTTTKKTTIQEDKERNKADVLGCNFEPYTLAFWLVAVNCIITYGIVYPFNSIGTPFLIRKFLCAPKGTCCPKHESYCEAQEQAELHAGQLLSVPLIMSGILSPFIGALSDVVGLKANFVLMSALLMMGAHIFLSLASSGADPLIGMLLMGAGFSIYGSVLWPCIPYLVIDSQVGVAFGLVNCLQNMGLALYPMIIVAMRAHSGNYDDSGVFFLSLGLISTVSGIGLILVDMYKLDSRLNGDFCCRDVDKNTQDKKKQVVEVKGSLNASDESTPFLPDGFRHRVVGGEGDGAVGDEV